MARRTRRREYTSIHSRGGSLGGGGSSGDPNWANVSLLLDCDGIDGAGSVSDASDSTHTVSLLDGAELDTADKKFGTASLLFASGAPDDYAQIADHADFEFGAGDFTIEGHFEFNSNGYMGLVTKNTVGQRAFQFFLNFGQLRFNWSTTGSTWAGTNLTYTWTPTADQWYHIALVRDGGTLRLFIDGTQVATQVSIGTDTIYNSTSVVQLGGESPVGGFFKGHMDNIRITKGVARYTGNFTAPTTAFPTS